MKLFTTRILFSIAIVFNFKYSHSQSFHNSFKSSRTAGLSGITAAHITAESYLGNPASLGFLNNSILLLNYENRFINTDIRSTNFISAVRLVSNAAFAFSGDYYGVAEYNQVSLRGGYGMKLSDQFSLGAGISLSKFNNPSNDNPSIGGVQLGVQYTFTKNFSMGASFHKLLLQRAISTNYNNYTFILGFKYEISPLVMLLGEIEKTSQMKNNLKLAFEYQLLAKIQVRSGISTYPSSFSTGLSFLLSQNIIIDSGFSFYQHLGLTPSMGLRFPFKNSKQIEE